MILPRLLSGSSSLLARAGELGDMMSAAFFATAVALGYLGQIPARSLLARAPRRVDGTPPAAVPDVRWTPAGGWSALDLRTLVSAYLPEGPIVVLAHREPCIHDRTPGGGIVARWPAGGVVTALDPILRACGGVWVAHGSGTADRETADARGRLQIGGGDPYWLRRVWLSDRENRGFYHGFANEGLWPLCHVAGASPVFRRGDWESYQRANRRFADAVADEVRTPRPIVFVHDYHFALAPAMLRRRIPGAVIVTFWHIPWPDRERLEMCPYSRELVRGLLDSDIVGFQTERFCQRFLAAAGGELRGPTTEVRAYPISIAWPRPDVAAASVADCRLEIRRDLGLQSDCRIVLSVDRLEYTKGLDERLAAVDRLLESRRWRDDLAFVQIAAPSRAGIARYQELAARVRQHVERINARHGRPGFSPVVYLERHTEPADVFRYYRAADVCCITSLEDGMNLVAKEFVAARDDERGVLVLSRFAGAAHDLTDAVIANPYDIDGMADALSTALTMRPAEERRRMRALRAQVSSHNVYRWAGDMLLDAIKVRSFGRENTVLA